MPNFFDKEKYVLHFENLQLYLRLGLKLKKTYCILESNQSEWLKLYPEFKTQKRIEADKIMTRKTLYILMNNAIDRKAMENLRNLKLVTNEKYYLKCTSKPSYMSHKTFENNLVAICKSKVTLKLNKPAYTGIYVLEFSKVLMYEFHYDYIKNEYGNILRLLFTDNVSLLYEIKTEDAYEDFSSYKE